MNKNKTFLISATAVLILNALIFGAWFLFFSEITAEKNMIQVLREETEKTEKRLKSAQSLNILLQDIKNERVKISHAFLDAKSFVGFIEELELIGRKSGANLTIRSVKLPEPASAEKPRLEFQLEGSFENIFHYLFLFENLSYKIAVEKFNLTEYKSDKKTNWRANMEIELLSYENS